MDRLRKRLIVVFCIGVFLCGIGAGIAFAEFGALSYGGEHVLIEGDMQTGNYDVAFQPEDGLCGIVVGNGQSPMYVQTDKSVPVNTVRFRITYNAELIEPYAFLQPEEGRVVFSWRLKDGKIVSLYTPDFAEEVTVWVNPESLDDVELIY